MYFSNHSWNINTVHSCLRLSFNQGRARLSRQESRRILGLLRERGRLHQAKYSRLKTQVETKVPQQSSLWAKSGENRCRAQALG